MRLRYKNVSTGRSLRLFPGFPLSAALLAALTAFSCATLKKADNPFEFSSAPLFGMVYDAEGVPVQGIAVTLDGSETAASDVNGRFFLQDVSRGDHGGYAIREGYEPLNFSFSFLNRSQILYLKVYSLEELLAGTEQAMESGDLEQAESLLDRAEAAATKHDPVLLYLRAVLAWKTGDMAAAVEALEQLSSRGFNGKEVSEFLNLVKPSDSP